ncbi:MAG TPA: PH domain-containing protein, partial [Solirubrobacteraceae bacterium]|nr:PH domain-containing protein [Solirubrobacteraceae bacterium]
MSGGGPRPALPADAKADAAAAAGLRGEWQRLHPLSPLVRTGRGLIAIVFVLLIPGAGSRNGGGLVHLAIIVVVLAVGVIAWLVTRWRVEGGVLRVDSGLIRRTSERFPLSQIQAVDTVRPGLARMFGLAELRIRVAGGGAKAGRLAYLSRAEAEALRARLLALSRGEAADAPATAEERTLVSVAPRRLLASIALSGAGVTLELVLAALVVLAILAPGVAAAALSGSAASLVALVLVPFRRFNGEYRLTVAEADDGLHVRGGLIETSVETIPRGRIQALRMLEPLLWRPWGWCRLEIDVAMQKSKGRQDRNQAKSVRALLPVGGREQAQLLLHAVFPGLPEERLVPPARARWKSPLRFRYLSWAGNERYAVTTSGRVRRVTDFVPLEKLQSVRLTEGPMQRRLRLASVHLDTAGRRAHAVLRDRDAADARRLLEELPARCRRARRLEGAAL